MIQGPKIIRLWRGKAVPVLILLITFFTPFMALAQAADVAVEVTSIAEGRPFWIAIEVPNTQGMLVSWIDTETGERGVSVSLDLPEGFEKGETLLPGTNFLNEDIGQFAFIPPLWALQEIRVDRDVAFSKDYAFAGTINWHECAEDDCGDASVGFSFTLPFGPGVASADKAEVFSDLRARVPRPFPWPVSYRGDEETFELLLHMPEGDAQAFLDSAMVPLTGIDSIFLNSALTYEINADGLLLTADITDILASRKKFETVLIVFKGGEEDPDYYYISVKNSLGDEAAISLTSSDFASYTIWLALLFAFLGGLILNLMPCVFPVLTLKVFTLVKAAGVSRRRMRLDGLAYTAGILFSFVIVALLLLTFRSMGEQVGWGFQLQSPYFVVSMAVILLLVALVFLGVINIRLPFAIGGKGEAEGALGSFYTGMFATLLATPCTAPFMAPALGFALTLETMAAIAVFLGLGLGLAAPYLLVSFTPKAQTIFPKPGPWMETFKKILAIPILLTVGWLGWVLYTQTSDEGLARPDYAAEWSADEVWNLRLQGKGVLVNYTATWCITCIVNERLVFQNEKFQRFLADNNIVYMEADWTNPDPNIAASLESLGRSGLPVYAFYPPGGPVRNVVLLPEILTLESAMERISAELE